MKSQWILLSRIFVRTFFSRGIRDAPQARIRDAPQAGLPVPHSQVLDKHLAALKSLDGVEVQRVVCGGCKDFKVVTSVPAADFGAWEVSLLVPNAWTPRHAARRWRCAGAPPSTPAGPGWSVAHGPPSTGHSSTGRAVLNGPDYFFFTFLLRTALKDRPKGPPTANRQLPSTANRHQPPTTHRHQPPATNRRQPPAATNRQLPTATNHQSPTTNRRPTTTNRHQPPVDNCQPPTATNRHQPWLSTWSARGLVPEHFFFFR